MTAAPDVGFVACIEAGVLECQALLLFESIRRYTGRFSDCAIYAVSPRAGYGISEAARRRLARLGVEHVERVLNSGCPHYGSANRVAAAAHIEATTRHETLVVLDSDTLFTREPEALALPPERDVAVRPVDVKGICTSGPHDPCDQYWEALCRCCGVDYDAIPWRRSFIDRHPIKANYNAGLVIARGGLGILRRWGAFFFESIRRGLRPRTSARRFRAGAGWVEPPAGILWGSNQAALSLAIWSSTQRVDELPATYNYPLHKHHELDPPLARALLPDLVHVHYHWLFAQDALADNPLLAPGGPLSADQHDWLSELTPID